MHSGMFHLVSQTRFSGAHLRKPFLQSYCYLFTGNLTILLSVVDTALCQFVYTSNCLVEYEETAHAQYTPNEDFRHCFAEEKNQCAGPQNWPEGAARRQGPSSLASCLVPRAGLSARPSGRPRGRASRELCQEGPEEVRSSSAPPRTGPRDSPGALGKATTRARRLGVRPEASRLPFRSLLFLRPTVG